MNERAAIRRMRRGQEAAARRQLQLLAETGPQPERAVAEALDLLDEAAAMGLWPGPRDAVSEGRVQQVRRRWVMIERHARRHR